MKHRLTNKFYLSVLVALLASNDAANAFAPSHRGAVTSRVKPTANHLPAPTLRPTPTQLYFDLSSFVEPLSNAIPALQHAASTSASQGVLPQLVQQMTETLFFPPAITALSTTHLIQTVGETAFAGMLAIAAMQGFLIMKQYQNNPNGGLIVPPGLTEGIEGLASTDTQSLAESAAQTSTLLLSKSTPSHQPRLTDKELEALLCDTDDTALTCGLKKQWYHITTQIMAIALIPLAAVAGPSWGLAAWMLRYGHIMHLAVIFGLTHIYDFFRKLPAMEHCPLKNRKGKGQMSAEEEGPLFSSEEPHILVLGDSMSVGIGTCEVFDNQKVYDIPLHKDEHLASSEEELKTAPSAPGPMFPRALARTLSQRLEKPVAWRSAGVDGGATEDIAEHLLNVVQDEVNKGHAPDVVVVLTGSNDLKHILNGSASVKGFRINLMMLADQIKAILPNTKVVYPALPTYRMDQKSILNVFPLSICLDSIMGLWDAQKMTVADTCPGVYHVDLTVADVNSWYKTSDAEDKDITLIAADGIHPNARCYEKWGSFVANKLAGFEEQQAEHIREQQHQDTTTSKHHSIPRPAFAGGFHVQKTFGTAAPMSRHEQ